MSSLTKAFSEVTLLSFAVFAACEGPTTQPGMVKLDSGRISGQSRRTCRQANGNTMIKANNQRNCDSAIGGNSPATARPTIALPAQNSAVSESRM